MEGRLTCNPKTHAHQCAAITRYAVLVANVIVACDKATRANTRVKTREARTRRTSFLCSPGLERYHLRGEGQRRAVEGRDEQRGEWGRAGEGGAGQSGAERESG